MPTILLINDDGINSPGLLAMRKGLQTLGEVVVVTPKEERSGIGKAISTNHVAVMETQLEDGGKAYAITGTPADAFLLALYKILKQPPDLVVAGINLGPNLGIDDFFTSGTLAAAVEAAIHGVPAIAVSYCIKKFTERQKRKEQVRFDELESSVKIACKVAKYVLMKGMPRDVDIISINVPEGAKMEKLRITRLSYRGYRDIYTKEANGYIIKAWILADYPDDKPGTDLYAIKTEKLISITPIKIDLTHNVESLRELFKSLFS